jgi:hypothetical protein
VHQLEDQRGTARFERGQVLARPKDDAGDADLVRPRERVPEQGVRVPSALFGLEVIRHIEQDGIDLPEVHELDDVDRLRRFGAGLGEILVVKDHVLVPIDLVPSNDLAPRDLFPAR